MKLVCSGSKNSPTYYIQKSVRIGNKTTSKTIERLGNIEEIKARCGDTNPIECICVQLTNRDFYVTIKKSEKAAYAWFYGKLLIAAICEALVNKGRGCL